MTSGVQAPPASAKGAAAPSAPVPSVDREVRVGLPLLVAAVALVGAVLLGVSIGPVALSPATVLDALLAHLPFVHRHVSSLDEAIVWNLRLPRVILACLVGAMLAAGGAAYQGTFRNPLADPYLLGVAAGAGLGATLVIVTGHFASIVLPLAAFVGGAGAVVLTYVIGASGDARDSSRSIVLAGVAVAALLTAVQTYLQQQHAPAIQQVYNWLLGSFTVATWSDVVLILPYVALCAGVLMAHRRVLDVLRVGEDEARALGIHPERTRLVVVAAATLGTAAAVSVSGLIGFVGIIVPHAVRLAASSSYRVVLPVSMVAGGAFLVLADLLARTVEAPAEVPIGVITALVGAPFFLFVLRSRRSSQAVR
ncbi:MAG TPA: iron ABC transporter permease [Acidimicrobiales bacterium]|nr:iron ABC transporter permease [Acidimicrobiales bacterium]